MIRLCSTYGCHRQARPGWAVCNECADRLLTPNVRQPEWIRRMKDGEAKAKDFTGSRAA